MKSTRLPGKVMMPLNGKPLLLRVFERVKKAASAGTIVIAATEDSADDIIEELCGKNNINIYRGNPDDLLDRHYEVSKFYKADAVVKIPSDCPLIDPYIIDKVIGFYLKHHNIYDYVSNLHPATYPDGNDVEIMSAEVLERSWLEASKDFEREHTTPYIWEHPDLFRIGNVTWESGLDYSMTQRWTIDYPEDYQFISSVYREFPDNEFYMHDILSLLDKRPELIEINKQYTGVNWYRHHIKELKTINIEQTRFI